MRKNETWRRDHKQSRRGNQNGSRELYEDVFLQPWFMSRAQALTIRRLLTEEYRHKMGSYFQDWGCLCCQRRDRFHGGNGLCEKCKNEIARRMRISLARRARDQEPKERDFLDSFNKRMVDARTILQPFRRST
jgi:hypothetical protein